MQGVNGRMTTSTSGTTITGTTKVSARAGVLASVMSSIIGPGSGQGKPNHTDSNTPGLQRLLGAPQGSIQWVGVAVAAPDCGVEEALAFAPELRVQFGQCACTARSALRRRPSA